MTEARSPSLTGASGRRRKLEQHDSTLKVHPITLQVILLLSRCFLYGPDGYVRYIQQISLENVMMPFPDTLNKESWTVYWKHSSLMEYTVAVAGHFQHVFIIV